jgi:hypothetical protein
VRQGVDLLVTAREHTSSPEGGLLFMTYILAITLSLIVSGFAFASEITAGNIRHLRNGRVPNAGAALFPTSPVFQLLAVGIAWIFDRFFWEYTVWVLLGGFLVLAVLWAVSFVKLRAELARATEEAWQK